MKIERQTVGSGFIDHGPQVRGKGGRALIYLPNYAYAQPRSLNRSLGATPTARSIGSFPRQACNATQYGAGFGVDRMGRLSDSRSPAGKGPPRRIQPCPGTQGDPRPAADYASASPVTAAEAGPATGRAATPPGTDPAAGPEPGRRHAETVQGPESQVEEGQARRKGLK